MWASFGYVLAESNYFLFPLLPIVGNAKNAVNRTYSSMNRQRQIERLVMRHPQRLHIRFFGTQIWAEGILGILGAIVIISAILAAYLQS
jgi:hypothetical protein